MTRPDVTERIAALRRQGMIVTAHRGASCTHPENTLAAFGAAIELGVQMIEFDVQQTADGALVCLHDERLDRTTDASRTIGPGALVAQLSLPRLQQLDAGSWKGAQFAAERIPTLAAALQQMLPRCVPMIEHKAGTAERFLAELQRLGALRHVLLQSFDWHFLADCRRRSKDVCLGLLGPLDGRTDFAAALRHASTLDASFVHWDAALVRSEHIAAVHGTGGWLCTYTTDDDAGLIGGAAMGIDAMCTNDPARGLELQRQGTLRRRQNT